MFKRKSLVEGGAGRGGGGESGGGGGRHLAQRREKENERARAGGRSAQGTATARDGPPTARPLRRGRRASYVVCVLATGCRDYAWALFKMHLQNHQKSPSFDLTALYAAVTMGGSSELDSIT
jgi:hypothetical protein